MFRVWRNSTAVLVKLATHTSTVRLPVTDINHNSTINSIMIDSQTPENICTGLDLIRSVLDQNPFRMKYQILFNYNMRNEPLDVADSLQAFEETRVCSLRMNIASKIFKDPHRFYIKLIFGGDLLEDDHTLEFYNITHLSVVMVVLIMPGAGVYQILMNYNDRTHELLDVADSFEDFRNTTVIKLKRKFRRKCPEAHFPKHLKLIFGGDLLEDDRTLAFYKIAHLSVVMVVMKMPGGGRDDKGLHQVLINYNDKKNKLLDVANSHEEFEKTTIRELKEKFTSSYPEVPDPDEMRVIFERSPLEDHVTLGYYKITPSSVLFFVLKMPGGGEGLLPSKEVIPRNESMERLFLSM